LEAQIILTFIVYLFCAVVITYYYNLLISKNEYSRDEIEKVMPQMISIWKKITARYSVLNLIFIISIAGLIGGGIPGIMHNSLINSALLPFIVYFFLPKAAVYFEETRVTTSENFVDVLEDIYVKYYLLINSSFIAGYATTMIYNWATLGVISFYWFIINFVIITGILVLSLKEMIYE
jgi:hypothetical protein